MLVMLKQFVLQFGVRFLDALLCLVLENEDFLIV